MTAPASDYSHRFHAGNVGDVWKHLALTATLRALTGAGAPRLHYLETHAGEGRYALGPTGEWTEGVGRLGDAAPALRADLQRAGFAAQPRRGGTYPGSPLLARALLRPSDRLTLFELDPAAHAALARALAGEARATLHAGDGLAALPAALDASGEALVLIDPPYSTKEEWDAVGAILIALHRRARFLLWYPIKSLTRPNALLARLRAAGVPHIALELLVTPLEVKRNALHGSGVIGAGIPPAALAELAAAGPALGAALATHDGRWQLRAVGG